MVAAVSTVQVDVKDIVEKALVNMIVDFPIYAQLVTRIGLKVVNEPSKQFCAWTDGRGIFINEHMVKEYIQNPKVEGDSGKVYDRNIKPEHMVFIIAHELMHLIGLTYDRGRNMGITNHPVGQEDIANWQRWNKATDYEINNLLHTNETTDLTNGDKKRNPVGKMPEWVLYDNKYRDMNAEEIYKELLEEEKKNPKQKPKFGDGDNSDQGNGMDGLGGLDLHLPIDDDDVRNEVISKIAEVYGSRSNGLGESGLDRLIDRSFKPVPFNWRRALSKYMKKWMKENYTWNKPSRAGIANNLILPSPGKAPKLNIGVAIDTSGSISEVEINTMMNHMFTILQTFKDFQIDVWSCGSKVYPESLLSLTGSNKKDLKNFRTISDGGNDMRENFSFIREHYKGKEKIDLLLVMTDGYDPIDGDNETTSPCPVIFLILDHKDFKKPSKIKCEVYPFEVENGKPY